MGDGGNLDVVRGLYEALFEGDLDSVLDAIDDEVELEIHGHPSVPFHGTHRGRDGLLAFFEAVEAQVERDPEGLFPAVHQLIDGGDTIVALGLDRLRVKASGTTYETWWIHILELRDRRVIRIREFIDTAAALSAFPQPRPTEPERGQTASDGDAAV